MRKILVMMIAVAVVGLVTPPAAALPHVSKREWRHVEPGMSKAKVHRIFDTRGRLVSEIGNWQSRTYRPWRSDIYLMVDFVRENGVWRLDSKGIDRDCGPCFRERRAVPPNYARRGADCVNSREYRRARGAWQTEGLTRPGVREYFGFDGRLISQMDETMKRRYRHCREGAVVIRYQHFPEAPGPTSVWWVVAMRRVS